ncbi:ERF family protein [Companilactobacillus allii]|uniref:Uncharacterized protein n=1 Tax=Companilactobacillus allii TaxID=1847728 RepID=A0A1P8Q4W5_9LACO|nr:ERF family protein [Companilactobacillus allii]APX72884.1 hypothetical protein BTM29_10115 [Companilactobacillus allii]USQ67672.1 ERF family protein [Companilactobacillus allii]
MTENNISINDVILQVRQNIRNPVKKETNPLYGTKYADLNEVLETVNNAFPSDGTFTQPIKIDAGGNATLVLTIWTKNSSEDVSTIPLVEADTNKRTNKIQMMGQAITYLRRYQLKSFFGLGDADDDGQDNSNQNYRSSNNQNKLSRNNNQNSSNEPINSAMNKQILEMIDTVAKLWELSNQQIYDQLKSKFKFTRLDMITNGFAQKLLVYLNGMKKEALKARNNVRK